MSDPVDEMAAVLSQTLTANALRLTTVRGGYVGGGQPHATLDSDPGATEAVARGLLARKVAEPSRATSAGPEEPGLDAERLWRAMCALDNDDPGAFQIVAISEPDTRPVAEALARYYAALHREPPR